MNILPVILAGGSGSRLWPLSRQHYPKQFLSLIDGKGSMLQETVRRLKHLDPKPPIFVCNNDHRFLVAEQLRQIELNDPVIILEPFNRGTAPAVALAAIHALNMGQDPVLLVLAADHFIDDIESFTDSIKHGYHAATENQLVTFGVSPTRPETGYGYIKKGSAIESNIFLVEQFIEKPNNDDAISYSNSGDYFWNSGIFMFKASSYVNELDNFHPEIVSSCRKAFSSASNDLDFLRIDESEYSSCVYDTIDYALMEKTTNAVVVSLTARWDDIGSWQSLWAISNRNVDDNVLRGDVLALESSGCYIHSENRLVTTLGVKDLVIIETHDAILVTHKDSSQAVKRVFEHIKDKGRTEHLNHRIVYRPWGLFDSIDHGQRYQVKRITVDPGARLSLQKHHHRAEHWIVVSGTAKVTNGAETYLITENQSTYIPIGQIHCLENPGRIPLELIEVQSGSYLGEDDIVRIDDKYGRA